jgi:hypothetical protein
MEWGVMTLGEGRAWQGEESWWTGRGFLVMTGVLRMVSASAVMKRDSLLTNRLIFSSVLNPDPGFGAFLTPGSGMGKMSRSGSGTNNPDYIS